MNTIESATFWMALVGFISGLYALWLSHRVSRTSLRIDQVEDKPMGYRITNLSMRPIPVLSVSLQLGDNGKFTQCEQVPTLSGISLPGVLPAESSFEIDWSLEQYMLMHLHDKCRIAVKTQAGKEFSYKWRLQKPSQHPRRESL